MSVEGAKVSGRRCKSKKEKRDSFLSTVLIPTLIAGQTVEEKDFIHPAAFTVEDGELEPFLAYEIISS